MGRISTGIGLISGINSGDIIDQLMALEARPRTKLQARIDTVNQQKLAYTDISTRLASLKLVATTLKKPSTFQAATTTSSNDDVLTATAANGAAVGSFQFQVARLVAAQQSVTAGFADFDSARVGAGTLTVELGGGEISATNNLDQLNGGTGVRRGMFRIIDRSGASAIIDTTAAVTLQDVVRKINTALDVRVAASIEGDALKITDLTGKTTSNLIVQDLAESHSAEDLGLVANVAANSVTGTDINYLSRLTRLAQLNDGRGVRVAGGTTADFRVTVSDGTTFDISVGTLKTVGEVIDAINTAGGAKFQAQLVAGSSGLRLVDSSGGGGSFTVTALNSSGAAADLGLDQPAAAGAIDGRHLLATLGTVLLGSLKGGLGISLGQVLFQDRSGSSATVDFSSARTVQDVLDAINNAAGIGLTAALNAAGNGILITDTTGGAGNLIITDQGLTTTAADLGLATAGIAANTLNGGNLQRQWVTTNTLLQDYNGGRGVTRGKFQITNSAGVSATVDLSQGNEISLADVIAEINSKGISVTARINANGDGLLLEDSAGGASKLKVEEINATTAADLNILGTATATTIDGSFEKTITLTATDTLQTAQTKINALGFAATASIINDGSGLTPFRLSLSARNSGRDARFVFDAGATLLQTHNLVEAQDAAVFLGDSNATQPLLITAGSNQISGVIRGVTIDLHGVSSQPVTLSVTRSADNVVEQVQTFADDFNALVDKIAELTSFDTQTNTRGLLLGDATLRQVQNDLYAVFSTVVPQGQRYRLAADIGLKLVDGAKVEFDEEKLRTAYAENSDAVSALFTTASIGVAEVMESRITRLIDPANGLITRENALLDSRTQQFQDRIEAMDRLLETKRQRLQRQFANLESVLASLQSQQQSLAMIQNISLPNRNSRPQ